MINQEIADLHERFASYRIPLAQIIDQRGEMVPLPHKVKLEKPQSFTGVIDTDAVNAFIFQVE